MYIDDGCNKHAADVENVYISEASSVVTKLPDETFKVGGVKRQRILVRSQTYITAMRKHSAS
jgi:hypothetical protein